MVTELGEASRAAGARGRAEGEEVDDKRGQITGAPEAQWSGFNPTEKGKPLEGFRKGNSVPWLRVK